MLFRLYHEVEAGIGVLMNYVAPVVTSKKQDHLLYISRFVTLKINITALWWTYATCYSKWHTLRLSA